MNRDATLPGPRGDRQVFEKPCESAMTVRARPPEESAGRRPADSIPKPHVGRPRELIFKVA